jgi:hypothetical protein
VLSVLLLVGPVLAAVDEPAIFHALSQINGKGTGALPEMADGDLASVEGGALCIGCVNIAIVIQTNVLGLRSPCGLCERENGT